MHNITQHNMRSSSHKDRHNDQHNNRPTHTIGVGVPIATIICIIIRTMIGIIIIGITIVIP